MKKQELIHIHGLLAEVRNQTAEDCDLGAYAELGVKPTSIHRSKTDHKEAVFALLDGITAELDSVDDSVAATAD